MPLADREMRMLAARISLRLADRMEIYEFADRLACEGIDDPHIIEILVEGKDAELQEIQPYMVAYLAMNGYELPDVDMAPLEVAYLHAKSFTEGQSTLGDVAGGIWKDVIYSEVRGSKYDFSFVYVLEEGWDDASEAQAAGDFEAYVRKLVSDFEAQNFEPWEKPQVLKT